MVIFKELKEMKNILLYFVFLIALGGCKSEFVEPKSPEKVEVKFSINFKSDQISKLATTVTRPMVDNMLYTVYVFDKDTEAFIGSKRMVLNTTATPSMYLDPNEEYIFVAVSNNTPAINNSIPSQPYEQYFNHSFLPNNGETAFQNAVIDSITTNFTSLNNSLKSGYSSNTITYYGKVDNYGVISSTSTNLVSFNMALVNFLLDVEVDVSDVMNEFDSVMITGPTDNILLSPYAMNANNAKFLLSNGQFIVDDAPEYKTSVGFVTPLTWFKGPISPVTTYSTYMTEEDPNGSLVVRMAYMKNGWRDWKVFNIQNLYFEPGHRAKLKLKVLTSGKATYDFEINYNKEPDINVNL